MSARENILAKLKKADALPMEEPPVFDYYREMGVSWANDVERLKHWAAAMRAVKTEIYWVTKSNWPQVFRQAAEGKGLKTFCSHWKQNMVSWLVQLWPIPILNLVVLSEKSTTGKRILTDIEAGFSGSKCGIARTGTIMLESSPVEPRSLSLVPPVHFCLFDTSKMYNEFHNAVEGEKTGRKRHAYQRYFDFRPV